MKLLKRWLYLIVPMLILAIIVYVRINATGLVERQQLAVFDFYQQLKPRAYTPLPVMIIDIDDESLKRLGQWPWPRTILARLLEQLVTRGALVTVFDIVFAEPDRTSPLNVVRLWSETFGWAFRTFGSAEDSAGPREEVVVELPFGPKGAEGKPAVPPDHDLIFANMISENNVVTGHVLTHAPGERLPASKWDVRVEGPEGFRPLLPHFSGAVATLPAIEKAAMGNGSLNLIPERDAIIRRVQLAFQVGDTLYPSLSLEALRVFLGVPNYTLFAASTAEGFLSLEEAPRLARIDVGGEIPIPTDKYGRMWIYHSQRQPERHIPAWKLFDPDFDLPELLGSIVFVGASAAGLGDSHTTPLSPVVAGVEIHAGVVEQILLGEFLTRPEWADELELLYLIVLGTVPVLLLRKLGIFWCALLAFTVMVLAIGYSLYAFAEHYLLIDLLGPSGVVLVSYLAGSAINFAQSEAERRHVRRAFTHYLAPAVIEQLINDPERLGLRGEKRVMTFVFTDIAGFTSLTERSAPEVLVELLNGYLDETCNIVLEHGGTIDKIVGDALHVIFNAPVDQSDHAERAVRCALKLDSFCQSFVAKQAERGIKFGETRVGVNTGPCVVGNFGGTTRFDYTAHGDAINTAARLESVNQHQGTRVCVSATTVERCNGLQFRPIARLVLKGKTEALQVFEPVTPEESDAEKQPAYLEAYQLVENQDPRAARAFEQLATRFPDDRLIAFHNQRLAGGETGTTIVMQAK